MTHAMSRTLVGVLQIAGISTMLLYEILTSISK